ncbi:hypothetical protein DL766_005866 [Monosporascus sp. MC13-8B]|uniref:DUF676 domain-containing protein n=1 Tax=Monosporascus cannonballus TaxID=155416 RepID=A0ABY0HCC5_9PEZI|nr:hypothetical protein DL762_002877 [Monosporascus cannonballus]RYO95614.1 hypothetical protein DL763_003684 [Monosporascus cannonballus]RYP28476.1 hypothetical protein DL766_005866 [Monosporascus sp. MC13-8B]
MFKLFGFLARAVVTGTTTALGAGLTSRNADKLLKFATNIFTAAGNATVVDTILEVLQRSLEAMTQSLSGAVLIWRGIFTNGINQDTLRFILNNLGDIFRFIYDLFKPGNVVPDYEGVNGAENQYNELDLRLKENRQAVVHQVQRVALTLIAVLRMGRDSELPSDLAGIDMNVRLSSDFQDGTAPPPLYVSKLAASPPNEKWLFINGIANEVVWFRRSCDKIRDRFKRQVTGVYNRSDGILWDFIECCGERGVADESNVLIQRTESSKRAQEALEGELRQALWAVDAGDSYSVVVIAHSQGCLLLRLALQTLVQETAENSQERRDMQRRLRLFTFGNPSVEWRAVDSEKKIRQLSEFAAVTEHFAHTSDFVARLGVATDEDSGYDRNSVFYSKEGRGHLFGAHYSLDAGAYQGGENSILLKM